MMTGSAPLPWAVVACVGGAIVVELMRQLGKATGDIGLAILFYGGLAAGVLMAGVAGQGAGALAQFLFGSLTTVSDQDLITVAVLGLLILIPTIAFRERLFAVCADEEYAKTLGLPVRFYSLLIVVLAALAVTIAMRTVGLLLVSALMVIPVATAQNLLYGFKRTLFTAMAIGTIAAVAGTVGSFYLDSATGATIVVFSIAFFVLSLPVANLLRRRTLVTANQSPSKPPIVRSPEPDGREHEAVLHGDHVDYVYDGEVHHSTGEPRR